MSVQKLRLKSGWSQQQLAEISGLSVRTIQRIEAGRPAGTESLKSLAAVFEVEFSTLNPEQIMKSSPSSLSEQQEGEAFNVVRKSRRFYVHLFTYIIVTLTLLAINLIVTPSVIWAIWVMAGWGLGVLVHAYRVFRPRPAVGTSTG